ncbi:hypothetical protein FEM48_Zijuj06G0187900 [Ziziphus jujuba var. spinosa]|uniref:Pectinesterase inhibitor domain-containing protein n=1 Tax=Ziziphus jujuba var. spinosa TaxID=714518 RepID=A0A978VB03_ZIZJJ|nr:hypothetical protein FEM48_Zijuj06G0187900 [Ziziphus jujuba var. spinosa]
MDFPTQFFKFFTISLLIFLSSPSPPNVAASKLIDSVCKRTLEYSTKCQQLIGSDPKTKTLEDPKKLAEIVLQMSIANAQSSYDFINQMIKSNPAEPIKKCLFWYEAVVDSFKSSQGELKQDPQTANYDAKTAGDNADTCDKELAVGPPIPEISDRNDQVRLHSRISDAATNMVQLSSSNGD